MEITYGCDCDCGNHQGRDRATVPVAFLVERDGKQMKVCTRCDISSDKRLSRLFDGETPFTEFFDFDPLSIVLTLYVDDAAWEAKYGAPKQVSQ